MMKGVYTAMVTPFDAKGNVDYDGFVKNIHHQIKGGIDAILVLGTTGETPTLSHEEQVKLITLAVKEAKGKVKVMVGTGANSTAKTIEHTKEAKELGADEALVVTPYYNKPTQEGIYLHFKAVTEAVDIPIVVYNIQGRTGVNIATPTLKRISELKNIIGVKEASGNLDQMMEVVRQINHHNPKFSVMSGDDPMTFSLLGLGGHGVISVISNLVPERVVAMVSAYQKGDIKKAQKLHFELLPLFKGLFIETNPLPVKYAMSLKGMPSGGHRLPLCEMMPENKEKTKKLLQECGIL